jgi:hypothetical protein
MFCNIDSHKIIIKSSDWTQLYFLISIIYTIINKNNKNNNCVMMFFFKK